MTGGSSEGSAGPGLRLHESSGASGRALRFGVADERVVTRATIYGTRNIQVWAVVDVLRGGLRRWSEPPLDGVFAPLLGPGERVGKQYDDGVEVKAGALEGAWLVYGRGEPNCCPTGGVVKVRLSAGEGRLRVARTWREPFSPREDGPTLSALARMDPRLLSKIDPHRARASAQSVGCRRPQVERAPGKPHVAALWLRIERASPSVAPSPCRRDVLLALDDLA